MSSDFIHTEENGIKYLVHPKGSIFEGIGNAIVKFFQNTF